MKNTCLLLFRAWIKSRWYCKFFQIMMRQKKLSFTRFWHRFLGKQIFWPSFFLSLKKYLILMTKFILKSSTKKQEWLKSIVHILRYALRIFSKSSIRMPDVIIMPNVIIIMLDTVPLYQMKQNCAHDEWKPGFQSFFGLIKFIRILHFSHVRFCINCTKLY